MAKQDILKLIFSYTEILDRLGTPPGEKFVFNDLDREAIEEVLNSARPEMSPKIVTHGNIIVLSVTVVGYKLAFTCWDITLKEAEQIIN